MVLDNSGGDGNGGSLLADIASECLVAGGSLGAKVELENVKKDSLEYFSASFRESSGGVDFFTHDRFVNQKVGNNNLRTIYSDHFPIGFF